jgi:hypothetical protein
MIASKEKLADMRARVECLQDMEFFLSRGLVELAQEFGALSKFYAERIKHNDYTALDKKWALYHKLQ